MFLSDHGMILKKKMKKNCCFFLNPNNLQIDPIEMGEIVSHTMLLLTNFAIHIVKCSDCSFGQWTEMPYEIMSIKKLRSQYFPSGMNNCLI